MTDDHTLTDFDPDAMPESDRTITVAHVDESHDVYGGRSANGRCFGSTQPLSHGWLGNPYRVADYGRDECIDRFDAYFERVLRDEAGDVDGRGVTNAIIGLTGKVVACHCRRTDEDEPRCHLDVIRERLLDGTVFQIASEYGIPLTDWQVETLGNTDGGDGQ